MKISGQMDIAAPAEGVIAAMNDPDILQAILPSCSGTRRVGPGRFVATVTRKVGPLSLSIEPEIEVSPLEGERSHLAIRGGSRIIGQVAASLDMTLRGAGSGIRLAWDGEVTATGLAQRLLAERSARVAALVTGLFNELKHKVEGTA